MTVLAASEELEWNRALATARERWPGLTLSDEAFMAYVRERDDLKHVFSTVAHVDELYLCAACAHGDAGALVAFEATYFSELGVALKKLGAPPGADAEIRQLARHHLFVRTTGPAKVEGYTATGSLRKWVRVVMTRFAINALSRMKPEVPTEDEFLDRLVGEGERDPELAYMVGLYRDAFRDAFREALGTMEEPEQALLRCAFQQDLSIDAIAALYGIHRSTAARRVIKVRDELLGHLRAAMQRRFRLSDSEYESLFRFVRSQLDVEL